MEQKKYYLGLDMGTNSVGWAVTDENYHLLRAKRKDLWGIREFDEALTSAERRMHRVSRRSRQRQQVRIGLLKLYFHDAIVAVDPAFYQRLENSKYHLEDKDEDVRDKNALFHDEAFTDKEYFKKYPTIFHLRKELIENTDIHDVRLVFLALLNMFKHRGHFLSFGTDNENESQGDMESLYREFAEIVSEELGFPESIDGKKLEEILSARDYSRTVKAEKLSELFVVERRDKTKREFIRALCGLKTDTIKLFGELGMESEEKIDFSFTDAGYDDKVPEIARVIGEDRYHILEVMKAIYDKGSLAEILKGHNYLSYARVASYEKHKNDLKRFKTIVKAHGTKEDYEFFFRSEEDNSYSAYVGSVNVGKKHRRSMKGTEFIVEVKKYLEKIQKLTEDSDISYLLHEIETENFMPKQLTSANGIIPNYVHLKEMKKILKNAESYLPFLKEKDESGLSVTERICSLFSFQIPYYVGPTTEKSRKDGGNGWVVRREEGTVLPWNIWEKIDKNKTQERFIENLIRKCTYINGEKVLPKASLMYERYCVLNEINNLRIDGDRISVDIKQDIYRELYMRGKKVTRKQLVKYLKNRGMIDEEAQVSGIDINLNNYLSSYGKFLGVFGEEKMKEDHYRGIAEDIIRWATIYGESGAELRTYLCEKYKEELDQDQVKRILGFKFKDWGKLSKAFLELQGCDKADGEVKSLIQMLWDTNLNMMELINSPDHTFGEELERKKEVQIKTLYDFCEEDLEEYYFSAPVKRMIWQTILVIREITKVMGGAPERVFVEMTRKPEDKPTRRDSRKQKFLALYANVKEESKEWKSLIETAEKNGTLRSKKMYLYLTQMGRDMYTGKHIELDQLFDNNLYDIDHIYPRHFVKDDNIDNNLALVYKPQNAHKSDQYPLGSEITGNPQVRELWTTLHQKGFINDEKYRRLTGREAFTEKQQADFIARQLVETSQGTKGVAEILKMILPQDTAIVYAKASNVSDFRHRYDLPKSRLVNDFHHANDAYLNIVVGNVYYTKFTQNPLNFIRKEYKKDPQKYHYNLDKMYDWDIERGGKKAWTAASKNGDPGTIRTVKEMMCKNTPLLTRMNYTANGGIANETLYGRDKAKPDAYIPLKSKNEKMKDVTKYGGFTSVSVAYFFLVEYEKKGKKERSIEAVPIYLKDRMENNIAALEEYCKNELGLEKPSIRLPKIKLQSLISKNGYRMYVSGKTNKQIALRNASSICFDLSWIKYINKINKYIETGNLEENMINREQNIELFDTLTDKHLKQYFSRRPNPVGEKLKNAKDMFEKLCLEDQCRVLYQILQLTIIGVVKADLTLINESKNSGVMLMGKNITKEKDLFLINQSVTGIYENYIDLVKI